MFSIPDRTRVIPIAVFGADASIATLDNNFSTLVFSYSYSITNCFRLGTKMLGVAGVICSFDRPSIWEHGPLDRVTLVNAVKVARALDCAIDDLFEVES